MKTTLLQGVQLLHYIYTGMYMGLWYGVLGLFRSGGRALDAAVDACFWAAAALTALEALLGAGGMVFRGLALAGFAAGFALYTLTLGRLLGRAARACVQTLAAALAGLERMLQ